MKSFKYCLKQCKKNEDQLRSHSITNSLKKDFTKKSFWSLINGSGMRKKKENKFLEFVGGASSPEAISRMWSHHYHSLLNCLTPSKEKLFVDSDISSCIESYLNNVMCSVPVTFVFSDGHDKLFCTKAITISDHFKTLLKILQSPTNFCGFHIKNTQSSELFIAKGHAVSAVTMDNTKMLSQLMSKSRSLAKINERRLQPISLINYRLKVS